MNFYHKIFSQGWISVISSEINTSNITILKFWKRILILVIFQNAQCNKYTQLIQMEWRHNTSLKSTPELEILIVASTYQWRYLRPQIGPIILILFTICSYNYWKMWMWSHEGKWEYHRIVRHHFILRRCDSC